MKRQIVRISVALACAFFSGCQSNPGVRPKTEDAREEVKVDGVASQPPKGFFRNSRLSGALSDEGRDIEKNLGVR